MVAASLKDVVEPDDVTLNIHIRILYAISNSGLSCQIHNNVELVSSEQLINLALVGNVHLPEDTLRVFHAMIPNPFMKRRHFMSKLIKLKFIARCNNLTKTQLRQAIVLEPDIILVVKIVYTYDFISPLSENPH